MSDIAAQRLVESLRYYGVISEDKIVDAERSYKASGLLDDLVDLYMEQNKINLSDSSRKYNDN